MAIDTNNEGNLKSGELLSEKEISYKVDRLYLEYKIKMNRELKNSLIP